MAVQGRMGGNRENAVRFLNEAKLQGDATSKAHILKNLMELLLHRDPSLLPEFVPYLMELQSEPGSPVRKYLAEMIEGIGMQHVEHVPTMVPVVLALLQDPTPAVARRAITSGSNIFRSTLERVALQDFYTTQIDRLVSDAWNWMIRFKDAVYPLAFQHGNDGVRLLAVKFVETTILLFTPDANGSSLNQQSADGVPRGFNIAWIAGGHPLLDANALGQEASKNLGLLLNQLRAPEASSIPSPVAIVLVNSLAGIAKRRPSMFGRILPVLLALAPNCEPIKGGQVASVIHSLKSAFLILLKCNQPGAVPLILRAYCSDLVLTNEKWRERLVGALRSMNAGDVADQALRQIERAIRAAERDRAVRDPRVAVKNERVLQVSASQVAAPIVADLGLRKRPMAQENGNQEPVDVEESLGKRMRPSLVTNTSQKEEIPFILNATVQTPASSGIVHDNSIAPLLSAFASLVAQGERGASSVEILTNSLTPDMLAEIVIANLVHLSIPAPPLPVGVNRSASGGFPSLLPFELPQIVEPAALTVTDTEIAMPFLLPMVQAGDTLRDPRRDPRRSDPRHAGVPEVVTPLLAPKLEVEEPLNPPQVTLETTIQTVTVKIEGGESTAINLRDPRAALQMNTKVRPTVLPQVQVKQEPVEESGPLSSAPPLSPPTSSGAPLVQGAAKPPVTAKPEAVLSVTTSAPVITRDLHHGVTGLAQAGPLSLPVPLQPIPLLPLSEEQQTSLRQAALVRILEGHKNIAAAGGADLRIALLARLVAQSCEDSASLEILEKHILAEYQGHKGHELALHVLYQLYAEKACSTVEVAASTSAAYDQFLLSLAQGIRDKPYQPTDKSFSRLLGEAPVLPASLLKLVEELCNPKGGAELQIERVTQGLSALWSLILHRPPMRDTCLKIALKCTVHESDDVRTKAIRLVANKLYPLNYVAQIIEEFATTSLLSVVDIILTESGQRDSMDVDSVGTSHAGNGDQRASDEAIVMDAEQESQPATTKSKSACTFHEAQRRMTLYFALCTKKHALLRQLFVIYSQSSKAVKQAVHRHIPALFHTIGYSSTELLQLIADPPAGSENLLLQVLHTLTEGTEPSTELITTVKKLYETRLQDASFLIPVLSSLSKDEVLLVFPRLVDLPAERFQAALARILQGSAHTGPAMTPSEVLIALHGIDPHRDSVPLKKVMDACSACLQQRTVFTQQVLAKVLNQLVEQTPLPLLFMRTVIQAVGSFPNLESFVMEILSRLVNKQIWKLPKLWMGFLKCAQQTMPKSFHVLLQLPTAQLEDALKGYPNLQAPLAAHADQPAVRFTVPRSSLVLLGLAQDAAPPPDPSSGGGQPAAESFVVSEGGPERQPAESLTKATL